jgi:hypothetical protein
MSYFKLTTIAIWKNDYKRLIDLKIEFMKKKERNYSFAELINFLINFYLEGQDGRRNKENAGTNKQDG